MRRALGVVVLSLALGGCSKTPEEAAKLYNVQTSNGFKFAGGVAVTDQHILTDLSLFETQKSGQVLDNTGKNFGAAKLSKDDFSRVVVLYAEDEVLPAAKIGSSDDLTEGAKLATQVYNEKGEPELLVGAFRGWQFGDGVGYLVTDINAPKESIGAGYFGPDGKLVGLQVTKRGKSTLLLPIEYVVNGPKAVTNTLIGEHLDSEAFAAKRAEGEKHPDPIPEPPSFEQILWEFAFSRTALVGAVVMMDKKDGPAHAAPVKFLLESVDVESKREVVGEGAVEPANLKWAPQAEAFADLKKNAGAIFGDGFVKAELDPYDYGELRFRIPFAPFCAKVDAARVYVLTLTLADGRKASENFQDMANICTGAEEGDGTAWEKEWGMSSAAGAAPAAADDDDKGGKAKKKKKKKGRK